MSNLLEASIPPEAYMEEPMTVAEIDAHPDRARIWRTIKEVRETAMQGRNHRTPLDHDWGGRL